jgi:hypothetical protein
MILEKKWKYTQYKIKNVNTNKTAQNTWIEKVKRNAEKNCTH